ncbi:hypothetical protein Thermus77412_14140 [Thermus antranikianii]
MGGVLPFPPRALIGYGQDAHAEHLSRAYPVEDPLQKGAQAAKGFGLEGDGASPAGEVEEV